MINKPNIAELRAKLEQIAKLPQVNPMNIERFTGIEIDTEKVDYWCGGRCLSISWEDIDKPLSYFEQQFKIELDKQTERIAKVADLNNRSAKIVYIKDLIRTMELYGEMTIEEAKRVLEAEEKEIKLLYGYDRY